MDFNFTDEQNMIRDSLGRLIRDQYDFDKRREMISRDEGRDPAMWTQFAELGLLAAPFSEDDGGLGGNAVDSMVIMEEFGKGLVIEPYIPSVVCGGGFLKHGGTAAQKEEFLSGVIAGEAIFAFAYAEPKGRYNLADLETTAKSDGSGYTLNGHKAVVVGAPWATHYIVTARTSGDRRDRNGVSVFIVPAGANGVTRRDYPTVDGSHASEVYFENVSVPNEHRIGDQDAALPLVEQVADEATAALCAEAMGAMGVINDMTVEYAKTRKQFGVPIGSFQVLQHRMVDMFMEHQQAISMTYMVTLRLSEDEIERKKAASAAKVQIGKGGRFVGQSAVQIYGGMGVTEETAVGHYFKRLSILESQFGSTDFHLRRYTDLSADEMPTAMAAE